MKPSRFLRSFLFAAGSSLLAVPSAAAQTDYYWDQNGGTSGTGGTGNWNTTDSFWRSVSDTGTLGTWSNGSNDAIFAGTAGTVTINSGNVTARSLVFNTGGYIIARSGSNTLTIDGATADHGFFVNADATISAVIAGSNGLIKNGSGTLQLTTNASSFTGDVKVNAGRLMVYTATRLLGSTNNNIVVASGTQLFANQVGLGASGMIRAGNTTLSGEGISDGGSQSTRFGALRLDNTDYAGTITLAADSRIGGASFGSAFTNTLTGKITGAFGVDFFGATTANNGIVSFVISNTGNDYTGNTTITNGAYNSAALTSRTNLRLGASNVIPNGASAGNVVFALSGTNNARTVALDLNGFSETINGLTVNAGSFTSRITNGSTSGSNASVLSIGDNNTTSSFSGIIEDNAATRTLGITKIGNGTLTLSNTNTYRGATSVNAGTLTITGTGSINTTSGISVASGATFRYNSSTALTKAPTLAGAGTSNRAVLGGTGSINATVTLNNTGDVLSPGNSPGIQNYTVGQTWASFSYDWEVNNFTGTTAGTDFDQIGITGTLNLTGGSGSYILNVLGLTAGNVAGLVPNFSETDRSWTILTSTGLTGFNAANWTINTTGFTDPDTGTWALAQSGNNLVLSYTIIPEPRAALLGGIGVLMLLRRRRQ